MEQDILAVLNSLNKWVADGNDSASEDSYPSGYIKLVSDKRLLEIVLHNIYPFIDQPCCWQGNPRPSIEALMELIRRFKDGKGL